MKVGVPIVVVGLLAVIAVVIVIMMAIFTLRQRKKIELSHELGLQQLSSGNVYLRTGCSTQNTFEELEELDMEYNYASLEILDVLGEGEFGRVFKARAPGLKNEDVITEKEYVAAKSLKSDALEDMEEAFVKEVKTCVRFHNDNVIRLLGICTKGPQKCMIFEYMNLGGLNDLLRRSDPESADFPGARCGEVLITPDVFLHCVLQVAQGLAYLASLKFVHRDIATRNCLVNRKLVIKIADFGMSREMNHMDYYRVGSAEAVLPVRWMPPEALLYGKFTVKSDVWSFGVLMWEMYTFGHQPYSGISNHEVIDRVKVGGILNCPELCPASVYDIMKSCWVRVPSKRPQMTSILSRLQLLIGHNAEFRERYISLTPASLCYANLMVGVAAEEEEIKENRRVSKTLSATHNPPTDASSSEDTDSQDMES